jgi:hypothetical protein
VSRQDFIFNEEETKISALLGPASLAERAKKIYQAHRWLD